MLLVSITLRFKLFAKEGDTHHGVQEQQLTRVKIYIYVQRTILIAAK